MEVQLDVPKRLLDERHSVPLFLYFGISGDREALVSVFSVCNLQKKPI